MFRGGRLAPADRNGYSGGAGVASVSGRSQVLNEEGPALARPIAGVSVLVVEDFADARTLYTMVLTLGGAQANAVGSVAEAREAFEHGRVDVVVSDLNMADEDGFDLIRWLRARSENAERRVPALALTAQDDDATRDRAIDAGFDEFLGKPIDAAALVDAVRRLVGRD